MKLKKLFYDCLAYVVIFLSLFNLNLFGFDIRIFALPLILLYLFFKSELLFRINVKSSLFIYFLSFTLFYSYFLFLLFSTNNFFEILRTFRSLISFFIFALLFSTKHVDKVGIYTKVKMIILLHSISILIGILFPEFESFILFISQYDKEQLLLRSTGFSSGYDDAGFLINLVIAFDLIDKLVIKKRFFNIINLILVLSIFFTSRFNILILLVIFFSYILIQVIMYNKRSIFFLFSFLLLIILSLFTLSITIDFPEGFRTFITQSFPFIGEILIDIFGSYSDYGIYDYIIGQHIQPLFSLTTFELIVGKGIRVVGSDIGFIKTIYSVGLIGFSLQYITLFISSKLTSGKNIYRFYFLSFLVLSFIIEFKMQFLFSSGGFEFMLILYFLSNLKGIFLYE